MTSKHILGEIDALFKTLSAEGGTIFPNFPEDIFAIEKPDRLPRVNVMPPGISFDGCNYEEILRSERIFHFFLSRQSGVITSRHRDFVPVSFSPDDLRDHLCPADVGRHAESRLV
jgi:hypothetical protein